MKRKGFTLIELLVVIAIIAILAAILFPVFAKARSKARQTQCTSNMKQQGIALAAYNQDFDETMPIGDMDNGDGASLGTTFDGRPLQNHWGWRWAILPYQKNGAVTLCPEMERPDEPIWDQCCNTVTLEWRDKIKRSFIANYVWGYRGMASGGRKLADITRPASIIMTLESVHEWAGVGPWYIRDQSWASSKPAITSHNGMSQFLFFDGHVKTMSPCRTPGDLNYNNGANPPDDMMWSWWANNGGDWENPDTLRGWVTECKALYARQ